MSSILTNNSAMVALDTLRSINKNLASVQNEISTGKTVSSAKDNAAIWAISTVMSTDVESFKQISDSLNVGTATVGIARAASETITGLLQDMKELIVSAQQDMNDTDRAKIQTDIESFRTTISNTVNGAQYNGVNLLKGTSAMSVLASLDRASDGTVTATSISVSRNDLSTTAAADAAAKESGDAGYVSTSDSATVQVDDKQSGDAGFLSTSQSGNISDNSDADITVTAGTIATGDTFTINVNSTDYTYEAVDGDTINDVADALKTLIEADSIANLTVTVTPGADPTSNDATINLAASGGAVTFDESGLGATSLGSSVIADGDAIAVGIAGGTLEAGETFTVSVGGNEYTYEAAEGDTNNDVAAGLKALIEADSISNLTVTVTDAADPTSDSATLTLTADGGDVDVDLTALDAQTVAVAGGGLAALQDIDVSTAAGAATALTSIESLLDTAISAASSFGSSQKQIEAQGAFVMKLIDSMNTGIGAMVDADMEAASARLQALQVQQQLGVQSLTIANQSPQVLLSLFR